MVKFNVDGAQNVEVSVKFPCEKSSARQLEIMEEYTRTHQSLGNASKEERELACLRVLYPELLREIEPGDLFAGRVDYLPIGFGCVTSLGGVGHYCVFNKLRAFQAGLLSPQEAERAEALYRYWLEHDLKTKYCREVLTETTVGRFIDCDYPLIATARLSGMMLDYGKLLEKGIDGLREEIIHKNNNAFYRGALGALELFTDCALALREKALLGSLRAVGKRRCELQKIADGLQKISREAPETFHEAIQLFWLYSLLSGVINYGRLDDFLGPYLSRDIEEGRITQEEAYAYVKCLWTMIENRRTTVNGRVIVGGMGRKHPKEADLFLHLCLRAAKELRYVEPQFTLRVTKETSDAIWNEAMDALAAGATYPTIYNDEVNVSAVQYGMRLSAEAARQYVPFGCTEYVIQGQSTGSPNVCMNLLKMLTLMFTGGVDPVDGKAKNGPVEIPLAERFSDFDSFWGKYRELLDYYMDLSIKAQSDSYKMMNREVSFLFTSILTDDCLARGKPVLDGGVRYLGGTNEIYGLINVSDSLYALKKLVFEEKKYSMAQVRDALAADFKGCESLRLDLWNCEKYGNDLAGPDEAAVAVYEYVAKGVRDRGIGAGLQYFLVVISNNQLNTEWGKTTGASPDGRHARLYMNPANNPQGGANRNGPTAMLNSLARIDARYHGGSVQNIKFSPSFFQENRDAVKKLFQIYFAKGGCHIMVTVVGRGVLEDAMKHPENHKDLIVRVSGFSAVFVNLDKDIQKELVSRVLYE